VGPHEWNLQGRLQLWPISSSPKVTLTSQANEFNSPIRISPSSNQFICHEKQPVQDQCEINPRDHQEGIVIGGQGRKNREGPATSTSAPFSVPLRSVYLRSLGNAVETQGAIKSFKWLPWHFIICRSERPKLQIALQESLRVGVAHRPSPRVRSTAKDSGELEYLADHGIPEQGIIGSAGHCIWIWPPTWIRAATSSPSWNGN